MCQNLILNALQWVQRKPSTGGTVLVRTGLHDDRKRLWIRVQDDGYGIHRRLLPRLFEFGFTTRANEGTGLGLYVTRLFVEQMGGQVSVEESLMLVGTTFRVDLPVAQEAA
ncbi:MAG: ATP-binding protein [Chloroflexi bacterium]|nr:ATP-binding protein [Chloroflexota bacterium]